MENEFPVEIERKFRVLCIPINLQDNTHLRQWYIPSSMIEYNTKMTLNKLELVSDVKAEWQSKICELINLRNTTIRIRLDNEAAILCIKGKSNGISRIELADGGKTAMENYGRRWVFVGIRSISGIE